MTRAQQTLSVILLLTSLYLALYLGLIPLNPTVQSEIIPVVRHHSLYIRRILQLLLPLLTFYVPTQIRSPSVYPAIAKYKLTNSPSFRHPQLPFYSIMVLGAYLLFRLGWGVYTFNDVPEAHATLQEEIIQAKNELRNMRVDVD
ncbi:hypothetical protein PABG_01941 [Paracoccidioides brasiliensis Pb03]|uniref:Dolichol-phosphate mannosyltransferase subunit 3 n=1 Tax=Paracoccidioides brasiliensis TaxID=121759 RepID=A0A1D2J2U9_PARBR|nr:hypothetical protein PABG_01941 [Paracoccidioides brasiliensis Pb03]ODH12626.1 hypothetical protein ACO22_08077 [Paracoccidioides brasiliensis]ODH48706.1 hypothetical protein GX48_05141 [Paracoccidioides brasiliensis]